MCKVASPFTRMVLFLPVILIVLLGLSAFFSSAEVALFSLNPLQVHRLSRQHPERGALVERFLVRPTELLSTILVGNTTVNVCASIAGFVFLEHLWPGRGKLLSVPVITLAVLIFGEIMPKRLAVVFAERMALAYGPWLEICIRLARPANRLLGRLSQWVGQQKAIHPEPVGLEELETVVDITGEHGAIDPEEQRMVRAVLRLGRLRAADIMTPRVDLTAVEVDTPSEELLRVARESWTRYLPLYRDDLDNIVGFLDVKAFLLDPQHRREKAVIQPVFIPETARLDRLLARFLSEHLRIALVVDEYGGVAGVVTRGDLLEEITGTIEDDMGEILPVLEQVGPDQWVVDSRWNLEDINDRLGVALSSDSSDRVSGWLMERLQRVPHPGDVVEAQGVRVRVLDVRHHRPRRVMLEKLRRETEG